MRHSLMARWLIVVMIALAASCSSSARAQVSAMTTAELTRQADVVAVGQVASLASEWNENHSRIRTRVTITVSEFLKGGSAGSTLTLYVPGGEVDGVGELYSDMAVFHRDESVVVFAQRTPQGSYRVAGGSQGKYVVTVDAATGKQIVSNRMTLDDLTARVKAAQNAGALHH